MTGVIYLLSELSKDQFLDYATSLWEGIALQWIKYLDKMHHDERQNILRAETKEIVLANLMNGLY